MTERKRLLLEKDNKVFHQMLKTLADAPQTSEITEDVQRALTKALTALQAGNASPTVVYVIAEILRLSAPKNVLGAVELALYFDSILVLLPRHCLNLRTLIKYRIPALLKDSVVIAAYFDAYSKISLNQEYLDDIIAIFVEENESCRHLITKLLECKPVPKSLLSRILRFIDIPSLSDEQYVQLFATCTSCMTSADLRVVSGRSRILYVRAAITRFKEEIACAYVNDRDARIRSIVAENCPNPEIFYRLLHDSVDEVRVSLLEQLDWQKASALKVSDRLLDKSYKVREILFRIYREGVFRLRDAPIFDQQHVRSGQLNFPTQQNSSSATRQPGGEISSELDVLKQFIYKLFEGCLTCYRDEFVRVLNDSGLSLEFLYETRQMVGASEYLRSIEVAYHDAIPRNYRGFYLEYIYKGELTDMEIRDYLNQNIYEVLRYIRLPERYYDTLLEKAKTCTSLDSVEDIVQRIKHILATKPFIEVDGNLQGSVLPDTTLPFDGQDKTCLSSFNSASNILFINAHTKCPSEFIEQQLLGGFSYPRLYFLVHQAQANKLLRRTLATAELSEDQRTVLLVYMNDPAYLCKFADFLLERPLPPRIYSKILESKSVASSLIYFLATGRVTVRNPLFFIWCVRTVAHCASLGGVKRVVLRYVNAVDQSAFDVFYSICWELKGYVLGNKEGCDGCPSRIGSNADKTGCLYGDSTENKPNILPGCDAHKLRLNIRDKILHFICELVVGSRQATLCEVPVDLAKHGFVKMSENEVEMVRHGQVIYE